MSELDIIPDDTRSRDWCLTDYTLDEKKMIKSFDGFKYYVFGRETCPDTLRKHLQMYVYYNSQITFKSMKKKFPKAHIELAKGTPLQASDYCKKDNDFVESGTLPLPQGKRTDIDEVRKILKETNSMKSVVEVSNSYQAVKMAEQILKYCEAPRTWKPRVEWFYGPTGTGKSKEAYEILGNECYTCMSTGRWFDGYDGHHMVLIDDMRKDFMKFHELLRLLDRYAMRIETKGGTRQFRAKMIIITSCYHPSEMFDTREDLQQLLRRIDVIREFNISEKNDMKLDEE